jgi:hypothetical protein
MAHLELSADSKARHARFVQRVAAAGVVWGLKNEDGWVTSSSTADHTEDQGLIPFWSDRAYAKQCATGEWAAHVPTEIPLDLFLEKWMSGMHGDGLLVGTNWNAHLCGHEIEPLKLRDEIVAARAARSGTSEERARE